MIYNGLGPVICLMSQLSEPMFWSFDIMNVYEPGTPFPVIVNVTAAGLESLRPLKLYGFMAVGKGKFQKLAILAAA